MLHIKLQDIVRATLPAQSGNEGWIGVAPNGANYHVVVPVDTQIAKGVMACNLPTDGTPFGGYSGWLYFRCPPCEIEGPEDKIACPNAARETGLRLVQWLAAHGIDACLETETAEAGGLQDSTCLKDYGSASSSVEAVSEDNTRSPTVSPSRAARGSAQVKATGLPSASCAAHSGSGGPVSCPGCGKGWPRLSALLRDSGIKFEGYRVCLEDFGRGRYLFFHDCGHRIEIPVSWFARSTHRGRSLIGSHACPGLCYYEKSLLSCSARCEGAGYRRIAGKLKSRRARPRI